MNLMNVISPITFANESLSTHSRVTIIITLEFFRWALRRGWFLPTLSKNWCQDEIRNWRKWTLLFRSFQRRNSMRVSNVSYQNARSPRTHQSPVWDPHISELDPFWCRVQCRCLQLSALKYLNLCYLQDFPKNQYSAVRGNQISKSPSTALHRGFTSPLFNERRTGAGWKLNVSYGSTLEPGRRPDFNKRKHSFKQFLPLENRNWPVWYR